MANAASPPPASTIPSWRVATPKGRSHEAVSQLTKDGVSQAQRPQWPLGDDGSELVHGPEHSHREGGQHGQVGSSNEPVGRGVGSAGAPGPRQRRPTGK